MPDLFDHALQQRMQSEAPLAARMRPRTLEEFIGQEHIVGEGKLLRRAIEADKLFSSILLWGPPGTGKTTLAQIIANRTQSHFVTISAILAISGMSSPRTCSRQTSGLVHRARSSRAGTLKGATR